MAIGNIYHVSLLSRETARQFGARLTVTVSEAVGGGVDKTMC